MSKDHKIRILVSHLSDERRKKAIMIYLTYPELISEMMFRKAMKSGFWRKS